MFRFPGKSSWEQHPWECEGGSTGQSEELGCDAVTAKASATAQEIWIRDGSAGSPTWVEGDCSLHCAKNNHKEERLTLELSTANILHSWETEVGHMDSTWCPLWPVQVEMPGSLSIAGLTRVSPNAVGCSFLEFF